MDNVNSRVGGVVTKSHGGESGAPIIGSGIGVSKGGGVINGDQLGGVVEMVMVWEVGW